MKEKAIEELAACLMSWMSTPVSDRSLFADLIFCTTLRQSEANITLAVFRSVKWW